MKPCSYKLASVQTTDSLIASVRVKVQVYPSFAHQAEIPDSNIGVNILHLTSLQSFEQYLHQYINTITISST